MLALWSRVNLYARLARVGWHIVTGLFLATAVFPYGHPAHLTHKHRWFKRLAGILGVHVRCAGGLASSGALVASNHVSWLDVIVIGTVLPGRFLAKAEVASWPLIGPLVRRTGNLFVARGRQDAARDAVEGLAAALGQDDQVVFFPEGTTSDGRAVLRFKPRLFAAAVQAQRPVVPCALAYPTQSGPEGAVPYIGDTGFFTSLLAVLRQRGIEARLAFAEEPLVGDDPRSLAEQARAWVAARHCELLAPDAGHVHSPTRNLRHP